MEAIIVLLTIIVGLAVLGIIIAFSPTLILTEIAVLTRSKKPFIHTVALISGISVPILLFSLAALTFVDPQTSYQLPSTRQVIGGIPLFDVLIGMVLIFTGIHLFKPRPNNEKAAKTSKINSEKMFSSKTLFWFGLIKMATSLSSIAAILIGVRYIKSLLGGEAVVQTVALFWMVAVSILPFLLIASMSRYFPKTFSRIKLTSDKVVGYNWRLIACAVMIGAGVIFIAAGIINHDQIG